MGLATEPPHPPPLDQPVHIPAERSTLVAGVLWMLIVYTQKCTNTSHKLMDCDSIHHGRLYFPGKVMEAHSQHFLIRLS